MAPLLSQGAPILYIGVAGEVTALVALYGQSDSGAYGGRLTVLVMIFVLLIAASGRPFLSLRRTALALNMPASPPPSVV